MVTKSRHREWWAPPVDDLSKSLAFGGMPRSLLGFVMRVSAWSQLWISLLAVGVGFLNTVPLELQRRVLNATVIDGNIRLIIGLVAVYGVVVLSEGLVKLLMNVYRGWVGEKAVRALRLSSSALVDSMPEQGKRAGVQGVEISLILAEPEPIGAFVGISISELLLQIGILLSVFGYMFYIQPFMAVVSLAVFSPQFVFVPVMQRAINRRVQARIAVLRDASVGVLQSGTGDVEKALQQDLRFAEIFQLNLGIFKLRYSMKYLMNLTQNLGKVIILGVGGWYVIHGETDLGTVVAFLSGLNNIADPWRDLVNWYQDMMVNSAKYQMFLAAMQKFARGEDPSVA
jgi:ABC-type bacteriocin/lantibiotic exporter with double-glycine peptidase domain